MEALERFYRLLDTIEAPYDTRTQRMMRKAIDGHEQPKDKVQAIIGLVEDLGLQPPPTVEPLLEIEERDVSLVAWLALVPTDSMIAMGMSNPQRNVSAGKEEESV